MGLLEVCDVGGLRFAGVGAWGVGEGLDAEEVVGARIVVGGVLIAPREVVVVAVEPVLDDEAHHCFEELVRAEVWVAVGVGVCLGVV